MAKKSEAEKYQETCEQVYKYFTHLAFIIMAGYRVTVEPIMILLRYLFGSPTHLLSRKELLALAYDACKKKGWDMVWDETVILFPRVRTCVVYVNAFGSYGHNISMRIDMKTGIVLKSHITQSG